MLSRALVVACGFLPMLSACGGESFAENSTEAESEADDDDAEDAGRDGAEADDDRADDARDDDAADDDVAGDDDATDEDAADDDGSLGLVIGDEVSLEQFPAAISRGICERLFACCTAEERGDVGENVDQCTLNANLLVSVVYLGAITDSQREGRLVYHADRAADCLRQLDEAVCDELPSDLCLDAVEPLLVSGEYCLYDIECIDGACLIDSCGPKLPLNEECVEDADCSSGHCSALTATCSRRGETGEACTENAHCASGNCDASTLSCGEPIPAACQ